MKSLRTAIIATFDFDVEYIPRGFVPFGRYVSTDRGRKAAFAALRKKGMRYVYRISAFKFPMGEHERLPILQTMSFGPWSAFTVKRPDSSTVGYDYYTYFVFSREDDRTLFKMVWS